MEDISALFRRLDLDEDQPQLSYLEFVNALLPWEKQKKYISPHDEVQQIVKQHQPKIKSSYSQVRKKQGQSFEKIKATNSFLDQPIILQNQKSSKGRNEPIIEKQSSLYVYTSHQSMKQEFKRPKTSFKENRQSILGRESPGKQSLLQQILDMDLPPERQVNEEFLRNSQAKRSMRSSLYTNTLESNQSTRNGQSFINTPEQSSHKKRSHSQNRNPEEEEQKKWDKYSMMRRGYKSPMPRNEEELFMGILKEQLRLERELQVYRENLIIKNTGFNPVQAYRIFAQNGKNLAVDEVKAAYARTGIKITEKEVMMLMKRYDSNGDGKLTYTDVAEMLVPKDFKLQMEFNKRVGDGKDVGEDLIRDLKAVLEKTVEVEKNSENLKKWLLKRKDFDMKKAFQLFSQQHNQQKVGAGELQGLLKAHGVITLDHEVLTLFQRFDKDRDGLMNFQDFQRELSPLKYREMKKLLS